jgi:hypothetical protein
MAAEKGFDVRILVRGFKPFERLAGVLRVGEAADGMDGAIKVDDVGPEHAQGGDEGLSTPGDTSHEDAALDQAIDQQQEIDVDEDLEGITGNELGEGGVPGMFEEERFADVLCDEEEDEQGYEIEEAGGDADAVAEEHVALSE